MGEAKRKQAMARDGYRPGTLGGQNDAQRPLPPQGNTGGNSAREFFESGNPSGTDRLRINMSVPEGVHAALTAAAEDLGMSVAQVTLSAVMAGLPTLVTQVHNVGELRYARGRGHF